MIRPRRREAKGSVMKSLRIILPALLLFASACRALFPPAAGLDSATREYHQLLRWREWDMAAAYAARENLDLFKERMAAAKEVRIVDYRLKQLELDQAGTSGEVEVELDYYLTGSPTLRSATDRQKWRYTQESGWRLTTLPPDFEKTPAK
jgi:hypothetical protein